MKIVQPEDRTRFIKYFMSMTAGLPPEEVAKLVFNFWSETWALGYRSGLERSNEEG